MTTVTTTHTTSTPRPISTGTPVPTVRRIGIRATISQSLTMAYRGMLKTKHNIEQLFDVAIQPIIFTLMFTYIFGGAISGSVSSYLPVIIPGILVQTVITASITTGVQLCDDMGKGVFDRFRALPISRVAPLAGALIADMTRYVIAIVITYIVGLAIGWRPDALGALASAILVVVCAFALSWIFALMGVVMEKSASVQGISMLILFPLTFISNAFVPVSTMPGWLQAFVKVNPVSHLVTAVRELTINGHFGIHVLWSLLGAAVVMIVFVPLTVRAYMRKA
ncbi:ABC transporter permease [Gordonia jinhuaensis]|uniref:Transport permease protein n=1 Tax=Gordonia jinhuaensis TaxID=1517702 RepID=A0A916SY43_9ACTN|nr:ABC transporter permease [Gordonia jinhuaensis]GGB21719.1 transport permease protein [Gordonia jinhuaensis]